MDAPDVILRDWFESVWIRGDESAIERLMHPDAVVHGLGPEPMRGPAEFMPYYRTLRGALGGFRISLGQTIVQGDWVAVVVDVAASHTGDALGIQATGRPVRFHGITMARARDGRLVEGWNAFDFLTMYQQIGALPPGF